jgi:MarR family transcriptional regulator, organic hydroperoxide resistance regulator
VRGKRLSGDSVSRVGRVGEPGQTLFLESSTLTPLLKRLEASGYVIRHRDPSDERQVRVRLTNAGRALHERARDIPRCILQATALSRGSAQTQTRDRDCAAKSAGSG